jgi:hypothetical protein
MAHPTDYPSQRDISRLLKSSSYMNPNSHDHEQIKNARTLIKNFLLQNSTWAVDSIIDYCLRTYRDYGVTRKIIADEIRAYVMNRD